MSFPTNPGHPHALTAGGKDADALRKDLESGRAAHSPSEPFQISLPAPHSRLAIAGGFLKTRQPLAAHPGLTRLAPACGECSPLGGKLPQE